MQNGGIFVSRTRNILNLAAKTNVNFIYYFNHFINILFRLLQNNHKEVSKPLNSNQIQIDLLEGIDNFKDQVDLEEEIKSYQKLLQYRMGHTKAISVL
jgi:hypothetical protein